MKKVKISSIKNSESISDTDKMLALSNTGLILIEKKEASNYASKRITMVAGEAKDTGLIGKVFTLHETSSGRIAQYINGSATSHLNLAFTASTGVFGVGSSATELYCAYKTLVNGSIWIKNNSTETRAVVISIH